MVPNAEINQVIAYVYLLKHCTAAAVVNVFLTLRNNSVNKAFRSMVLK